MGGWVDEWVLEGITITLRKTTPTEIVSFIHHEPCMCVRFREESVETNPSVFCLHVIVAVCDFIAH